MIKTITRAAVLAVVAASLGFAAVAPAQAQLGEPAVGRRCSFSSITDPTGENDDVQTGQVNAGPLSATAPGATIQIICTIQVGALGATHSGPDACQVASPVMLQTATIPPTDDNEPPLCSYVSPEGQTVYMCTEVVINDERYYWDDVNMTWSRSNGVACATATTQEIYPGPLCAVTGLLYSTLGGTPPQPVDIGGVIHIGPDGDLYVAGIWFADCDPDDNPLPPPPGGWFPDPLLCPALAALAPGVPPLIITSQGDVYIDENLNGIAEPNELLWDCPPYNP